MNSSDDLLIAKIERDLQAFADGLIDGLTHAIETTRDESPDAASSFIAERMIQDFVPLIREKLIEPIQKQLLIIFRERIASADRLRRIAVILQTAQEELQTEGQSVEKTVNLQALPSGKWTN